MKSSITPFLWFNQNAEEAVRYYCSIFKKSKVLDIARYGKAGAKASGQKAGSVMTVRFKLNGQKFIALNGGPHFKITPAISFVIHCRTQKEIDHYWSRLSRGGGTMPCGWLYDKFGVSWQVVPDIIPKLCADKNEARRERVMAEVFKMKKLKFAPLLKAWRSATTVK